MRAKQQVISITQILNLISKGALKVPHFQRHFVWKAHHIMALFDSIAKGYPIGSVIFWQTDQELETFPKMGPHNLPQSKNHSYYILDGHQRLATLYGVLTQSKEKIENKQQWWWTLYYDLRREKLTHVADGKPKTGYIPLHSLIQTVDFLGEIKKIKKECQEQAHVFEEKAGNLAQTIRDYQIVMTQLEGGTIENATSIFSRLNSTGIAI